MSQLFKLTFFVLLTGALFSCKKTVEQTPDPAPGVSLSRTAIFPNQPNIVKSALYFGVAAVQPRAFIEGGKLNFSLNAHSDRTGEGLLLAINELNLQWGPLKTYKFSGSAETLKQASYSYGYTRTDGSSWGNILDTRMGAMFEGELTITAYDAARRLISGRFNIKSLGTVTDPTRENSGSQIDPVNFCILDLEGQFSNIKIQ